MRFLVSGVGGDIGQSIARVLADYFPDAEVLGSDIHDEFFMCDAVKSLKILPSVSSPLYEESLKSSLCDDHIDVFIPTSEPELRWFLKSRVHLTNFPCTCLVANLKAMEIGFDKLLTSQHLAANNLPAPWASLASESGLGAPEIPCIFKSRTGAGNSSVHYIDSYDQSLQFQNLFPDHMWQQFLPLSEGEYTCGVYRCRSGETRVIAMKRRLASGVTAYARVVEIPAISELCVQIAESLDLFGSINIQLRLVQGIGPMVFEINPRFSSTVGMRHLVGFKDLIWSIEEQFLNQSPAPCPSVWPNAIISRSYQESCMFV